MQQLKAFSVNNGRSGFVVLSFRDPHLLERGQRSKKEPPIQTEYFLSGGATTLTLMVDGARAVTSKFFGTCKTFLNLLEHSGTTGQDNVLEQISTNIDIAFQAPKISFHPSSLFSPFSFHPQPLFPSSPSSHLSSRFSLFMISVVS